MDLLYTVRQAWQESKNSVHRLSACALKRVFTRHTCSFSRYGFNGSGSHLSNRNVCSSSFYVAVL